MYAFVNWEWADIRPQIRLRKIPDTSWLGYEPLCISMQFHSACMKLQATVLPSAKFPCCIDQLIMCLAADPGVLSLIRAQSHTFTEIDHEIISTAILLPSADSRRVVVSYNRKYVHKVLVNRLVKLAQKKKCG